MTAEIIEDLVSRVLAESGVPAAPPVDLQCVAHYLGVETVREANMVEDGRLEQVGGRSCIYVRTGVPPSRRRFTIAHELGHIVLAGREAEFIAHRSGTAADPEERFCNQFAAALLIPRHWLLANMDGRDESLRNVRGISQATGASLAASVVRLREVLQWRSSLLQWRRVGDTWRLSSTVGLPSHAHNRITSTPHTRAALSAAQGRRDHHLALPVAINGSVAWVTGEVSVRATSAIMLGRVG